MTAKNIDLDKLEWSEWEYYGPNDAVKFFERSRGCYAMHNAWATVCGDRKFIVVKGVIDERRVWRELVHGGRKDPQGFTSIEGTWQFAKIPQEAPEEKTVLLECPHPRCYHDQYIKVSEIDENQVIACGNCDGDAHAQDWIDHNEKETNQPNAFPSDDVEKKEPEYITSETDAGKWKIITHCHRKGCDEVEILNVSKWIKAEGYLVDFITNMICYSRKYRIKNPNFKPKKEPKRFDIWTYENDHGKALWLTQCTDEKHGGWDSLTYYRDQDRLAPVGRHWANQFNKLLGHTSDAEEAMKIISDYKINLSALTGGD